MIITLIHKHFPIFRDNTLFGNWNFLDILTPLVVLSVWQISVGRQLVHFKQVQSIINRSPPTKNLCTFSGKTIIINKIFNNLIILTCKFILKICRRYRIKKLQSNAVKQCHQYAVEQRISGKFDSNLKTIQSLINTISAIFWINPIKSITIHQGAHYHLCTTRNNAGNYRMVQKVSHYHESSLNRIKTRH